MVRPERYGFWSFLVWKRVWRYTLCPFWSGIGYGFRGNYGSDWAYLSFQFQMNKNEVEICEFEMYLKKFLFALLSRKWWRNFCLKARSGKRVWVLEVWSQNGCGKWHVLVWCSFRIWRTGRHTPPRIARSTPLLGREYSHGSLVDLTKLVVFFEQRESAFPVGSDFFTIHKMFQKKKIIKNGYILLCINWIGDFSAFPLSL